MCSNTGVNIGYNFKLFLLCTATGIIVAVITYPYELRSTRSKEILALSFSRVICTPVLPSFHLMEMARVMENKCVCNSGTDGNGTRNGK
jgi:hypothetical protein